MGPIHTKQTKETKSVVVRPLARAYDTDHRARRFRDLLGQTYIEWYRAPLWSPFVSFVCFCHIAVRPLARFRCFLLSGAALFG
jgi:hypothetical protein